MAVSYKTRLEIWSKFAGRCAICNDILLYEEENKVKSFVGQIAHIIAQDDNGPRANPSIPQEQRDSFANLILLCHIHHKAIDDNPDFYTVEKLNQIRRERLALIDEKLDAADFTPEMNQNEYLKSCVKHIICNIDLAHWSTHYDNIEETSLIHMEELFINNLKSLRNYLMHYSKVDIFPKTSEAIMNFSQVLNDFLDSSQKYVELIHKGSTWFYILPKFYHSEKYSANEFIEENELPLKTDEHSFLLKKYNFYNVLIRVLMNELAYAINNLLTCSREELGRFPIPQIDDYYLQNNFLLKIGSCDNYRIAVYPSGQLYTGLQFLETKIKEQQNQTGA